MMNEEDLNALLAPSVMRTYCSKMLATRADGSYICPWVRHENKSLEIGEYNGIGWFVCRVCGRFHNIFSLASGVLGISIEGNFPRLAKHIAETVGLELRQEVGKRKKKRSHHAGKISSTQKIKPMRKNTKPFKKPQLNYLPENQQREIFEAVQRAADNPKIMNLFADNLGLPLSILMSHTDLNLAERGLLGISADGHLMYIYTHRDKTGKLRFLATKQRGFPSDRIRFWWDIGCAQGLFGFQSAEKAATVIITEGESDCLAVRASLQAWLDQVREENPDSYAEFKNLFAVVAKPSALTFKDEWAWALHHKDVILCVDDDKAGKLGAEKTKKILEAAGAYNVYTWSPSGNIKDAREAFCKDAPDELIKNIIVNKSHDEQL